MKCQPLSGHIKYFIKQYWSCEQPTKVKFAFGQLLSPLHYIHKCVVRRVERSEEQKAKESLALGEQIC